MISPFVFPVAAGTFNFVSLALNIRFRVYSLTSLSGLRYIRGRHHLRGAQLVDRTGG